MNEVYGSYNPCPALSRGVHKHQVRTCLLLCSQTMTMRLHSFALPQRSSRWLLNSSVVAVEVLLWSSLCLTVRGIYTVLLIVRYERHGRSSELYSPLALPQ